MATIAVFGALDTKGHELAFLKAQIEQRGHQTRVVDVGVLGEPAFAASITRAEVAAAGGANLATLVAEADRGRAERAGSTPAGTRNKNRRGTR